MAWTFEGGRPHPRTDLGTPERVWVPEECSRTFHVCLHCIEKVLPDSVGLPLGSFPEQPASGCGAPGPFPQQRSVSRAHVPEALSTWGRGFMGLVTEGSLVPGPGPGGGSLCSVAVPEQNE